MTLVCLFFLFGSPPWRFFSRFPPSGKLRIDFFSSQFFRRRLFVLLSGRLEFLLQVLPFFRWSGLCRCCCYPFAEIRDLFFLYFFFFVSVFRDQTCFFEFSLILGEYVDFSPILWIGGGVFRSFPLSPSPFRSSVFFFLSDRMAFFDPHLFFSSPRFFLEVLFLVLPPPC